MERYVVKILSEGPNLDVALSLLYDVYVKEIKWKPDPDNPAGITVDGNKLVDSRDRFASYFGLYEGGELAACCRICARRKGRFEVQCYNVEADLSILDTMENLVELNRLAVRRVSRGRGCILRLLIGVAKYCRDRGLMILGAPASPVVIRVLKKIEWPVVEGCTFKYESKDPFLCQLFLVTSADQMDRSIAIASRLVDEKEARMRSRGFAGAEIVLQKVWWYLLVLVSRWYKS